MPLYSERNHSKTKVSPKRDSNDWPTQEDTQHVFMFYIFTFSKKSVCFLPYFMNKNFFVS